MKVQVSRSPADNQAEDIVAELANEEIAGKERGRNYLDEFGFNKTDFDLELKYLNMPLPGKIVKVDDASLGESFKGKITGWELTINGMTATDPVSIDHQVTIQRSET